MKTADDARVVRGERHDDLKDAVLNLLIKYERAEQWKPGKRGRPPAAKDIPGRITRGG